MAYGRVQFYLINGPYYTLFFYVCIIDGYLLPVWICSVEKLTRFAYFHICQFGSENTLFSVKHILVESAVTEPFSSNSGPILYWSIFFCKFIKQNFWFCFYIFNCPGFSFFYPSKVGARLLEHLIYQFTTQTLGNQPTTFHHLPIWQTHKSDRLHYHQRAGQKGYYKYPILTWWRMHYTA